MHIISLALIFCLKCVDAAFVSRSLGTNCWQKANTLPLKAAEVLTEKQQRETSIYQTYSNDSMELPPHTALAQVLANQYGIDLSSVEPSDKGRGAKITAADVEYHAYKLSQPPTTPQALELAYSYGLDLNVLYDEYRDDETENEQPYYLTINDVELLKENLRSLRVCSERVKGKGADNTPANVRRRNKHLNELERRMEKNVGQLSEKALQAVGSVATVLQTVQSQVKLPIPGGILPSGNSKIDSVEDFDQDLADEIQRALLSAGIDDEEGRDLMSLLDMPLNGKTDEVQANGISEFNQNGSVSDGKENKAPMFFADPK